MSEADDAAPTTDDAAPPTTDEASTDDAAPTTDEASTEDFVTDTYAAGDDLDVGLGADDAVPSADDPAPGSADELRRRLFEVKAERDQHLADLQRVTADFANFRRRTEKRHAEMVAQAGSRLVEALLPVLDACDAAAKQGVEGVDQIADQLRHVLELEGLEVISGESDPFDPTRHEAAMSEPGDDDHDGPIVAEVLRPGYAWNGRVLRAAMVKVKG